MNIRKGREPGNEAMHGSLASHDNSTLNGGSSPVPLAVGVSVGGLLLLITHCTSTGHCGGHEEKNPYPDHEWQ